MHCCRTVSVTVLVFEGLIPIFTSYLLGLIQKTIPSSIKMTLYNDVKL